jgi:glycosyltransferase involved in cell wall biosynthesis
MRLTLVISSLYSGGAERVMSVMANYWAAKGWNVTLLTLDDGLEPPFYDLDSKIRFIPLGIAGDSPNLIVGLWNNLKRVYVLRRAIYNSQPKVVLSFLDKTNVLTLLAARMLGVPVVVSERIDPEMYSIGNAWNKLRRWTYPIAERVVVQTERARAYFPRKVQTDIKIIPNPIVSLPQEKTSSNKLPTKSSIIAIGRFDRQKGFDLLLQAFARLKDQHPKWNLTILGEGPLRAELESLRHELGLTDRVHLPGLVQNPYELLNQANLFVLSSRFEGFPNSLCEAMASGLPVIATDCPSGPREIIRDGVDGLLIPPEDVEALAKAMDRLMSDEPERKRLASRAVEITERFGLEKVMGMWEELVKALV